LSYLLRAHVVGIFCFALILHYPLPQAMLDASIVAVFAVLSATDIRRRRFVSSMNALGLVTSSAVLVALSHGSIEMHFHFFVMVGILTLYQDWLPFLLAIAFVVLHHGILGMIDPSAVYNHRDAVANPFKWALVHGAFILAASVVSVVAWRLNEEQSLRDPLTHLPNRVLLQDRVSHALARADRVPGALAMLFVDLDGFKDVNDSLGHAAGDQLLRAVAERVRCCLRPADTVARLGGDEFAILLEDLRDHDDAIMVAKRLLEGFRQPFPVAGREISVTASIGIALNGPGDGVDELLRNADVAMYTVKESGRGWYAMFVEEMHTAVVDRVDLEHQLRRALEVGEFTLVYQPVVALDTGRVVGLEALIRWHHPTRGLLLPRDFIDVAEATGAIIPIGAWVLDTACTQLRRWNDMLDGLRLKLSVNLSPSQVLQSDLVDTVSAVLGRSGVHPSELVLELTEAVMVYDTEAAAERLQGLKDLGARLAIDDFGTGYSSLSYLRLLPFDILKIDKTFVDGITEQPVDTTLGRVIIDLARILGLLAVAEGIERPEQVAVLRELGCPRGQGYAFSKPLPAAHVDSLIERGLIGGGELRTGSETGVPPWKRGHVPLDQLVGGYDQFGEPDDELARVTAPSRASLIRGHRPPTISPE
jgi:diguanylate cyclase (GGDEF)-like protein